MKELALFFAGALLCNAIPHLACGLRGEAFPTPFAKPRGVGLSSPLLNFYWGTFNGIAGAYLLVREPFSLESGTDLVAVVVGFLVLGDLAPV